MRRFLRIRILFVLIALLLVPALALPFAERLRAEWARYWEPHIEEPEQVPVIYGFDIYPVPNLAPVVCSFGEVPDASSDATDVAEFALLEVAAQQERLLLEADAFELSEFAEFAEFDQAPLLALPTQEYWQELEAREKSRLKAEAP